MKFSITKEHIKKGWRCNPFHCPIALAIKAKFPNREKYTIAVTNLIHINKKTFNLPEKLENFRDAFDHGTDVLPQEFELPCTYEI